MQADPDLKGTMYYSYSDEGTMSDEDEDEDEDRGGDGDGDGDGDEQ